ncbi:MAG: crotonase/enoyl-CoA hydratase family protein [Acidimicrobiales bacterium]
MVEYTLKGNVAVLCINRPEARNAVNAAVAESMEAGLDRLEDDDAAWVGIVTGSGSVFSAGADLKAIASGQAAGLATVRGGFAGLTNRDRTKPLIAAVDGPALAGGCEIALACDLIVASREARFGLPEVKRALVAAAGGLFRLPRALPRAVAMEMILTGDPISAERAHHLGMVNELCEPGQALDAALALAERITANAPLAVRESRKVVMASQTADDDALWSMSARAMGAMVATEDFSEGPLAFIEKRPPVWKGR